MEKMTEAAKEIILLNRYVGELIGISKILLAHHDFNFIKNDIISTINRIENHIPKEKLWFELTNKNYDR